jgi:acetamidase/formamidase
MVEMGTHTACDDFDRMIKGDAGMESIYLGNETRYGAHIMTGPIYVEDAEPGDLLMVEIINLVPRPNVDGKTFGCVKPSFFSAYFAPPYADKFVQVQ